MPTSLKAFHEDISPRIGRGSSWDSKIPDAVRRAARNLEQTYNFGYMKKLGSVLVKDYDPELIQINLLDDFTKELCFIRFAYVGESGYERYETIPKTSLQEFIARIDSNPDWINEHNSATRLDFCWYAYTDWPTVLSASPDLLQLYESLLLAATMLQIAGSLRDDALRKYWNDPSDPFSYQNQLNTVLLVEQNAEQGAMSYVMNPYVPR